MMLDWMTTIVSVDVLYYIYIYVCGGARIVWTDKQRFKVKHQAQRLYLCIYTYISSLSLLSSCSRLRKKHVIFADDEGLSLTEVRVMSEPSNVPPYWSMKFLEQITQGLVSPHPPDKWTVDFKQPASDYLTFR